jgi:integrase
MGGKKSIEYFIGQYPKQNTKRSYRAGLYSFLDSIYGDIRSGRIATKEERNKYEEMSAQYFTEERNHLDDLVRFINNMNGTPPATTKLKVVATKEWLNYNDIELSQKDLKTLRKRMPKAKGGWTAEEDFDIEVLKKVLAHTDEKGRALILTLASSGMRIGEALCIMLEDVDISKKPPEIVVRGLYTKNGETRVVFISSEAKEAVEEWLKIRTDYLKAAVNKNNGLVKKAEAKPKSESDDRLFPFSDAVVRELWSRALSKAGLNAKDNATGRLKYRVHGLRKFFRSQLALTCPVDVVEALMGHEGYLTAAYRRYTKKQMAEYYLKAEHHVTITGRGDIREIQDKLQDTQAAVKGYKDIISEQALDIAKLRQVYERLEGELEALKAREEARVPYDDKMTELMKRLLSNPELKELIKKELAER